jgi:hypothetical protein
MERKNYAVPMSDEERRELEELAEANRLTPPGMIRQLVYRAHRALRGEALPPVEAPAEAVPLAYVEAIPEGTCQRPKCGKPVENPETGRPRRYCSTRCRQLSWYLEKKRRSA